jgi:N-carbamoylputrescine amidase
VGLVQMSCAADPAENLERAAVSIRQAAARGAQIVCLPELFRSPYFCREQDAAHFDLAEPVPGPATDALGRIARELDVVIVASLFERRAAGVYHNTAAVIDADGALLGVYRKMHIPDDPLYFEKYYFTPGDLGFRNFDTRFGRIGILICWDQWYPEAARAMALMGAEVLFYPTAIGSEPYDQTLDTSRMWRRAMQGHAVSNCMPVAAANRIGVEDGQRFYGHSFIADEWGDIVAEFGGEESGVLVTSIDLARAAKHRAGMGFFRDRRPDLYGRLADDI